MKKGWIKILVIAACVITILASTTSAIANVKNLFNKKDDNTTTPDESTKTQAVLIASSLNSHRAGSRSNYLIGSRQNLLILWKLQSIRLSFYTSL